MNSIVIFGLILALGLCAIADDDGGRAALQKAICDPAKLDDKRVVELTKCMADMAGKMGSKMDGDKEKMKVLTYFNLDNVISYLTERRNYF